MNSSPQLQRIESSSAAGKVSPLLLFQSAENETQAGFLAQAMPSLLEASQGQYMALVAGEKGTWRTLADVGTSQPLPSDLLAEVLDGEQPQVAQGWVAAALSPRSGKAELLVVHFAEPASQDDLSRIDALAALLHVSLEQVRLRQSQQRRVRRGGGGLRPGDRGDGGRCAVHHRMRLRSLLGPLDTARGVFSS